MKRLFILLFFFVISFNSFSEDQVISCPSGDSKTCMILKSGDTIIGTIYKGEGGIRGVVVQ
ncbi:hypothetical protein [Algoriphagus boritolerans]|jgi:hypothetical protein|uniref:hypothetical protein n=1 Tax=Algoriphagus boritolerans TaxID=308111 RepID=UPI0011B01314|nr:hypothetical protein [Algoriphagus boritolerans]